MTMIRWIGVFLAACLWSAGLRAEDCTAPPDLNDGWTVAAPDSQGMDARPLCAIGARFTAWAEADAHAVLVLRHGRLVYEKYFTGQDYRWGDPLGTVTFDATTLHDLRSISKSVVSLLTGIAVGRGWITSIDQPVLDFFPEYADLHTPAKQAITIRHLLTMSSGLFWDESLPYSDRRNSETGMNNATDPARFVLEQPLASRPGSSYNYSGGSAALLAAILQKLSGRRIDALARDELFAPLGITQFEWVEWHDHPVAASGLRLRPRDLARIGQMVLDNGRWQGRQIVPADWIAASTAPQINGQSAFFYGYQWWLGRSLWHGRQVDWAAGFGEGGQRVFVIPALDVVVVLNLGLYGRALQGPVATMILNDHVLPAVLKD
jgi:CubicO group peptidase (beta-lactamase class C family)